MEHGPDVAAVDELCRLALAARRLGCRVQLLDVEPDLRNLLRMAGVDHLLVITDAKSGDTAGEGDLR